MVCYHLLVHCCVPFPFDVTRAEHKASVTGKMSRAPCQYSCHKDILSTTVWSALLSTGDTVRNKTDTGFCSQDTASLMEKTKNKKTHMFNECYEEKYPVLSSSDQEMATGEGQKGFPAKVMFNRLEVYKELTGEESCQQRTHKCRGPKDQDSCPEISRRPGRPAHR